MTVATECQSAERQDMAQQVRSFLLYESRSRTCVIEDESHDDRVPQLAGLTAVMATESTFLDEPEPLVEVSTVLIVRPDLKRDLVRVVGPRPVHDRAQEHGADAKPPVRLSDLHAEVGSAAVQMSARFTDEVPA